MSVGPFLMVQSGNMAVGQFSDVEWGIRFAKQRNASRIFTSRGNLQLSRPSRELYSEMVNKMHVATTNSDGVREFPG